MSQEQEELKADTVVVPETQTQPSSSSSPPKDTTADATSTTASAPTVNDGDANGGDDDGNNSDDTAKRRKKKKEANKSHKRKRGKKRKANEDYLDIKIERYDKLLYTAKKQLTKSIKQCRTFLVQKAIRKSKTKQKDGTSSAENSNAKSKDVKKESQEPDQQQQQNQNQQPIVVLWKELPMELVVQQATRQLGLIHANPNPDAEEPVVSMDEIKRQQKFQPLITTLLQHKRLQSNLEEWNGKVAEYRRWCLSLEERNQRFVEGEHRNGSAKQRARNDQQQQPTSLFCSLNNSNGDEQGGDEYQQEADDRFASYGPAATMVDGPLRKKNRQGQRARRAKAQALEAKKEGRQYQSMNWRSADEKKSRPRDDSKRSSRPREMKAAPEPPKAPDHPSWAAKQQIKTGIVAFKGTKITF